MRNFFSAKTEKLTLPQLLEESLITQERPGLMPASHPHLCSYLFLYFPTALWGPITLASFYPLCQGKTESRGWLTVSREWILQVYIHPCGHFTTDTSAWIPCHGKGQVLTDGRAISYKDSSLSVTLHWCLHYPSLTVCHFHREWYHLDVYTECLFKQADVSWFNFNPSLIKISTSKLSPDANPPTIINRGLYLRKKSTPSWILTTDKSQNPWHGLYGPSPPILNL